MPSMSNRLDVVIGGVDAGRHCDARGGPFGKW
jgi:hypothetical protein